MKMKILFQLIAMIILLSFSISGISLGLSFMNMPDDLMVISGIIFIVTIMFFTIAIIPMIFDLTIERIKNFFKTKNK